MFSNKKTTAFSSERSKTPRRDYIFGRQKELVLDLVTPLAGERLLDIGCGTGNNLQIFSEKWCSLTGIDASREKLEIARQKYGDRAELILAEPLTFMNLSGDAAAEWVKREGHNQQRRNGWRRRREHKEGTPACGLRFGIRCCPQDCPGTWRASGQATIPG